VAWGLLGSAPADSSPGPGLVGRNIVPKLTVCPLDSCRNSSSDRVSKSAPDALASVTCQMAVQQLYIHTDPDGLPSSADKCSFRSWSSDSYHPKNNHASEILLGVHCILSRHLCLVCMQAETSTICISIWVLQKEFMGLTPEANRLAAWGRANRQ